MREKVYGICGTNKCRKEVIPRENMYIKTYSMIIPAHSDTESADSRVLTLFKTGQINGMYFEDLEELTKHMFVIGLSATANMPNSIKRVAYDIRNDGNDLFEYFYITPAIIKDNAELKEQSLGLNFSYKAKPRNAPVNVRIAVLLTADSF